jgi:hypothetical protein
MIGNFKSTNMAIKKIDIKEFVEKGYLQEVNRRFFHPLVMALEVNCDVRADFYCLGGVWDYRGDEEGIYFDIANSEPERIQKFKTKKDLLIQNLLVEKQKE